MNVNRKAIGLTMVLVMVLSMLLPMSFAEPGDESLKLMTELKQGGQGFVPDEILVKFKDDTKPFRVVKVPPGQVKAKVNEYSNRPDVVYAEPNYILHAHYNEFIPNDPLYEVYQWNMQNFGPSNAGINMPEAWYLSNGGDPGVVVAVLDSGIAYENYGRHYKLAPDLANTSFVSGYDFVNGDSHPNDDEGHGTHVAGTIAQSTNNNAGVAGVAYNTSLMPVKVLNANGSGNTTDLIDGIRFAADNGAGVINMSLGYDPGVDPYLLHEAVIYANDKGVTIIASAGNDGTDIPSYPAAYPEVISVGATRIDGELAYYSNYGNTVDIVAPGGDVNVDQNSDGYGDGILQMTFGRRPKDFGYYFYQGTSMAAPHVAGVAALLIAKDETLGPDDVQDVLKTTANKEGAFSNEYLFGAGLLDAAAALGGEVVIDDPPSVTITAPADGTSYSEGATVEFTGTADDTEDGNLTASLAWSSSIDDSIGAGGSFNTSELSVGTHTITASVTDSGGNIGDDLITVIVNPVPNDAPVVTITAPADGSSYTEGATVEFTGTANDTEDGTLTGSLAWSSSIDGSIGTGGSFSISTLSVGTHSISASVTDSGDKTGNDAITITVNPVPNDAPVVSISTPANDSTFNLGDSILFAGSASDTEDGDLTAGLTWSSSIDGPIGSGGSFSTTTLSAGTHTITASVTDSGSKTGTDSISVTVIDPTAEDISIIPEVIFAPHGGRSNDKHLDISISVVEEDSLVGVEGVTVIGTLEHPNGPIPFDVVTGPDGTVVIYEGRNAASGTYTVIIISMDKTGYDWDGVQPKDNSYPKN